MKLRIYLLFVCGFLFQVFSFAQQNRFLYIQTENKQPFYVSLNNTIHSSTASGYLIIPKLQEGSYQLNIGFPKNEWPRQAISYNIGKKDEGVLLKNFGEQGWGFFNLQNSETTMATGPKVQAVPAGIEDDDDFTQVLSQVVNTPDLKIKEKIPDPEPVFVPEVKKAEPALQINTGIVARLSENTNDQGREMVYVADGDTISIFIPTEVVAISADLAAKNTAEIKSTEIKPAEEKAIVEPVATETKPVVIEAKKETEVILIQPVPVTKEAPKETSVTMVNSDCRAYANDEDFMKLRKKMASEENEIKMVVVAKKAFKSKCYGTAQIKNLSVLFLNDSGRFQFFESAYPYVSDSNSFNVLMSQLRDPYYITRFEALIRR